MKVRIKTRVKAYAALLSVVVALTMWAGLRTLMGWSDSLPGIIAVFIVTVWASPRIAVWAVRPLIAKNLEVTDD